ncbi:hypothetical protein HN51_017526 [Arachis hypogaea]|uniref:F-box protein n=2 Tax=Arachis hypogaea TaxID=3818 RepID=A0A445CXQ9_ARAHY|nr:F-box protein At3g12350 [Arachis ipaensis]QHN88598.1 F-box protein [Arachis hypogaea]RYR55661.1 hypothetical protein Ahy_A06g030846 [Arachis hypogaea]
MASSLSFSDFPEDVQLCILSFLSPTEIATFSCTSKRFVSLCTSDSRLWFTMCERRWGSKTQINKWVKGAVTYRHLYRTLSEWENLIGFWRRSGPGSASISSPSLLFFEWWDTCISGFRVSPSTNGSYGVVKAPFLWMGLSDDGQIVNLLDPDGRGEVSVPEFAAVPANGEVGLTENELIPVNLSFMGRTHFVVEENQSFAAANSSSWSSDQKRNGCSRSMSPGNLSGDEYGSVGEDVSGSPGSLPDRLMSEIYQHLANRTSPGSDKSRKQRRREKERLAKRKWEPEHFVKIENCSPTPSRPLQGLWKGICDDMNLAFYLVVYDDIGGIACRRVGDPPERFSNYAPVFWTSKTTFLETPFSLEEETLYDSRLHIRPLQTSSEIQEQFHLSDVEVVNPFQQLHLSDNEVVKRILHISSSYDLVIPDAAGIVNPRSGEGRIWQYHNDTFGFGFLCDNFVIDMKHIFRNGCIVDIVNP